MKYLKLFEKTIKYSDPLAMDNPLKILSEKLEKILVEIGNNDIIITRHFTDEKNKKILIRGMVRNDKFLTANLYLTNYNKLAIHLEIFINSNYRFKFNSENLSMFLTFLTTKFKNYQSSFSDKQFDFPFTEIDNIINEIEDFSIILTAKKYNL